MLKPTLQLRQTQKLVMNQRLLQSLKLLQVPTLELEQMLKQEITQNPLLEIDIEMEQEIETEDEKEQETEEEIDWEEYFNDGFEYIGDIPQGQAEEEYPERQQKNIGTIHDYLYEQWNIRSENDIENDIGYYIIGNIDEFGYLTCSIEEIASNIELLPEQVEEVLYKIQKLEPIGIGARTLQECLLLQLKHKELENTLAWTIVSDFFDDLERRRLSAIARVLKISIEEIQDTTDLIATLTPRPGLEHLNEEPKYIVPDLVVEKVGDEYFVYLNDKNVPHLRINNSYKILLNRAKNDEARKYVIEKLNSAHWLIRTIDQRRRTMIKVMNCIVKEQRDFLDKGIQYLHPMKLQDVADAIEMHESTISRVTTDKYVQTPRGVFELKFFFDTGLDTNDGSTKAVKSIKRILIAIIDNEDKTKPLSDELIVKELGKEGIKIARRTVAKYRKQLSILPARMRKRV